MGRFYVTTPIYYVNDIPHLGTAYTTVVADAVRRFHMLVGDETRLLTGTDEHGLKIEREAKERGMRPQDLVDDVSARFRETWPLLSVHVDDFLRTTEPRHKERVTEMWTRIFEKGDLYKAPYEDWYCVGCEAFKTEKELAPGNLCPLHQKPVEKLQEETYFFRLSKYQEPLLRLYETCPTFIMPESRRNEVLSFVRAGLVDLSVSRCSFAWGIPVPGDPKHVLYVWFDALTNYWSAVQSVPGAAAFWQPGKELFRADFGTVTQTSGEVVHLVGKDILRFHAIYWPAFLMSAGLPLPTQIFAHGFLTIDGQKMSKSLRNAVSPARLSKEVGADALRYHLLRAIAFGQDGDFDHAALLERTNADLGKNVGNLLNRTLGLCTKLTAGKYPEVPAFTESARSFRAELVPIIARVVEDWRELRPHRALEATLEISARANQFVDKEAPWAQAKKGDTDGLSSALATLLDTLELLSVLLWPAIPGKADAMRVQLGLPPLAAGNVLPTALAEAPRPSRALGVAEPLFPTWDKDQTKALLEKLVPPEEISPTETKQTPPHEPAKGGGKPAEGESSVTYDEFSRIDLRAGVVLTCERVPKKDKLLKLSVDLGEPTPRQIVAGLALTFTPEGLVGKRVVVVANLAPRDFGKGLVSHGMLLATGPSESLSLATVPEAVSAGAKLK